MGVISNKVAMLPPAILTEAGETLNVGALVSKINNKLYEVPQALSPLSNSSMGLQLGTTIATSASIPLDGNKILVAFNNTNNYGALAVVNVNNSSISKVSPADVIYRSSVGSSICLVKLSDNKAVVIHACNGVGQLCYAYVVTVNDDNSISVGTETTVLGSTQMTVKGIVLEENKLLVVSGSYNASYASYGQVLTISGTTITAGTAITIGLGNVNTIEDLAYIDSAKALVSFLDTGSNNYHKCQVLSVSGTTVTANTRYTIVTSNIGSTKLAPLDSTRVLCWYYDNGHKIKVLGISGVDLTLNNTAITAPSTCLLMTKITDTEIFGIADTNKPYNIVVSDNTVSSCTQLSSANVSIFLTPLKAVRLVLSSSASGTGTVSYIQSYSATGYTITNTGIYNYVKKAGYLAF
jgi:hypothetical protein